MIPALRACAFFLTFVHSPLYGPYWSVTRYRDIMTVDTSHQVYSSDAAFGGITLKDVPLQFRKESFIAMDPPRHDEQRVIGEARIVAGFMQRARRPARLGLEVVSDRHAEPFSFSEVVPDHL